MRRPLVLLAALVTVLGTLTAVAAPAQALTLGKVPSFGRSIEGFAPYQAQTTCTTSASKGAVLLSKWLLKRYPGSSSSGIMRACGSGGTSEHKDGRAFDWHVDYRTARGRAQGQAFMRLLRATDKYGNRDAIARRMGIMYFIWNDKIYSASRGFASRAYRNGACPRGPLSRCSATLRHKDHLHISLGWTGARAKTSFWDGTVSGVSSPPKAAKPKPKPKPAPKPAPKPKPTPKPTPTPTPTPSVPLLDQAARPVVELAVDSRSAGGRTPFSLKAGTTYRLVASGFYRFGTGARVADPGCSWHLQDDEGWARQAEGTTSTNQLKVVVAGGSRWRSVRDGECDEVTHTYVWDYTPTVTGPVSLRLDDTTHGDDVGSVTVRVLKAGASPWPYVATVPAAAPEPVMPSAATVTGARLTTTSTTTVRTATSTRTAAWLKQWHRYRVVVRGTFDAGDGLLADAECTRTPGGEWQRQRSADPLHPWQDSYDLYLDGVDLPAQGCSADHVYTYTFTARRDGNATFAVWDVLPQDNTGTLTAEITPAG